MDRRPEFKRNIGTNMDGFIPNRKGRKISEPFKKYPDSQALQPSSPQIGLNTNIKNPKLRHNSTSPQAAVAAPRLPAGVSWNPRIQDPSSVPLTRDADKKSKEVKRHLGKHRNWKRIVKKTALGLVTLAIIVGGYVGFKFFHNIDKVFGGNIISNISSLFGTTTLKGENSGRINILLAGDSVDDPNHGGAQLTDSIMLVSIDPKNNTGFLLSIPRDLWVDVPGLGEYGKINSANDVTNFRANGYPSNGMGQLEQIVNQDLGIPTDYYALIDYTAFRDAVNAVGGIRIDIQSPDPRGLFDPNIAKSDGGPLKLPNGWVTLNGQTALNLARARGDPCYCGQYAYGFPENDFDRTQHQRQMLVALTQKATTIGVLSNPVRIGQLFDSIGSNVETDLSLADVVKLAELAKGANLANAQSLTYSYSGSNPLLVGETIGSQDALVPSAGIGDYSALQLYYQKLTSNNPIVKESANVVLLNGGNIVGLAKDYENVIDPKGVNVTTIADAPSLYPNTEIMDDSGGMDPATRSLLETEFGNNIVPNDPSINTTGANFVVILGENLSAP